MRLYYKRDEHSHIFYDYLKKGNVMVFPKDQNTKEEARSKALIYMKEYNAAQKIKRTILRVMEEYKVEISIDAQDNYVSVQCKRKDV